MRFQWLAVLVLLAGCDGGPPAADPDARPADSALDRGAVEDATPDGVVPDAALSDAAPDATPAPDGAVPDAEMGEPDAAPDLDAAPTPDGEPVEPDAGPVEPDAGPAPAPQATPLITEVMAINDDTLEDEDGDTPDWIELYNPGDRAYDLTGHHLTDDEDEPTKWRFPAVELAPRSYLVVFASDKDRRDPAGELHTDFKLAGDGESVALTDGDGEVLHAFVFPGQVDGVSYGLPMRIGRTPLVGTGAPARLWVGPDPDGAERAGFDDRRWVEVAQGAGVDARDGDRRAAAPLGDVLATDIGPYLGPADAFWMRVPFEVPAGAGPVDLELTFDDGLRAWVDGEPVFGENDTVGVAVDRPDSRATSPVRVPLEGREAGPGVVAVRAVNAAADDGLFFAHVGVSTRGLTIDERPGYLMVPTPGADNIFDDALRGPLVLDLDNHPPLEAGQALTIGAEVLQTAAPVDGVTLTVRVMFDREVRFEMERAGPGRWAFELPPDYADRGQMIRWYIEARDVAGRTTRHPPFLDPTDSAEYYGTMVDDPIESNLPVYHWFVEDLDAAGTEVGTRGALFYDGELYDNIEMDLHGQATTRFPKKSYNFDFNRDHRFRARDDLERVKDFDLLTNYADKAKMRNTLSYGMFRDAGHAYHLVFPVRVQRNGEFFAVYEFVEDPDERWLRRMGYPEPFGSVYKCYDTLASVQGSEKKTREEEGSDDLAAFIAGLSQQGQAARRAFIYDNVDMAGMANFLAMLVVTSGRDCCTKNYYAYHDYTTDQWWYLPWDIDLTLGRNWTGSYFDDRMFPENQIYEGNENRLIGQLYDIPEFMEMYHRRLRTLFDELMQPPGVPYAERYLENEADRLLALIGPDGELDNAAWGTWGIEQTQAEAVRIMKEDWMVPRRQFIYGTQVQRIGGPQRTLLRGAPRAVTARYLVPVDDALGDDWTARDFDDGAWAEGPLGFGYENNDAEYAPLIGTRVRPQDVNPEATTVLLRVRFDADEPVDEGLVLRMKYDDGYVAYLNGVEVARRSVPAGPLNWRSEAAVHDDGLAVRFEDRDITEFAGLLRPEGNVLAIRAVNAGAGSSDMLIQPELVDGLPASDGPLPPAQREVPDVFILAAENAGDQSYVVIANQEGIAVDLSGWRLEGRGIVHDLKAGTVIPTDGLLFVVANVPRFRARDADPRGGQGLLIQGNWQGELGGPGPMSLTPGGQP